MTKTTLPVNYDESQFIRWYKDEINSEIDLVKEVDALMDSIKKSCLPKLETLIQLITQVKTHSETECKIQLKQLLHGHYELPVGILASENKTDLDTLFKSTKAILEKMWRKNVNSKPDNYVCLESITTHIKDLIRTSIVSPTLFHAQVFAERLEVWQDVVGEDACRKHFSNIKKIEVDKEAKLASGYFAYHSLVTFEDDISIEVQIFSQLTSAWRQISHKLYELSRIGAVRPSEPGTMDSRLVSLGHMLHLAECELIHVAHEMKTKI